MDYIEYVLFLYTRQNPLIPATGSKKMPKCDTESRGIDILVRLWLVLILYVYVTAIEYASSQITLAITYVQKLTQDLHRSSRFFQSIIYSSIRMAKVQLLFIYSVVENTLDNMSNGFNWLQ